MISASISVQMHGHHCFDITDPSSWELEELLADPRVDALTTDDDNVVKIIGFKGSDLLVRPAKDPQAKPYWLR